jgi:hypothetical protein
MTIHIARGELVFVIDRSRVQDLQRKAMVRRTSSANRAERPDFQPP